MSYRNVFTVPGGTSLDAIESAYQIIQKMICQDPRDSRPPQNDEYQRSSHGVFVMRAPHDVSASPRSSADILSPQQMHDFDGQLAKDKHFLDGIDFIIPTSGSTTGTPHLVGLSKEALITSAQATHAVLGGPGHWIAALPIHHIAGLQVLVRAALADIPPEVVDTTHGFTPKQLLPAIAQATNDPTIPGYLSLVPTQLHDCLRAGDEIISALRSLKAILIGGSHISDQLLNTAKAHELSVVTTYGSTETSGGCVYDGVPLPGVSVRTIEIDGVSHLAISGHPLMTRYLEGDSPLIEENDVRWLVTGDLGIISAAGKITVLGRADDVIISGGQSIAPSQVRNAVVSHPEIDDAWVFGIDDDRWGSIVAVATVSTHGIRTSIEQFGGSIREHVARSIGRLYAPRVVIPFDKLPMLPTGKVDQRQLRQLVQRKIDHGTLWRK